MMNTAVYDISQIRDLLWPVFDSKPVYRAVLFGSYAKGLADENSDVDIVIDSHGELRGVRFYGVLEGIVQALDKPVDLIDLRCIMPGSPILDAVEQGVVLYKQ